MLLARETVCELAVKSTGSSFSSNTLSAFISSKHTSGMDFRVSSGQLIKQVPTSLKERNTYVGLGEKIHGDR